MDKKIQAVTELVNKLSKPRRKKKELFFLQTRKMIRAQIRRDYGKAGFSKSKAGNVYPWEKYQAANRGKRKLATFIHTVRA